MEHNVACETGSTTERASIMEAIVNEHETALLRYAARITNNPFSAQDVVQNVFIKLFQSWQEGTQPTQHMRGWLFRATHNAAVDLIRAEVRRRDLHTRHADEPTSEPDSDPPDHALTHEERRAQVLAQLRHLKDYEQQVLLLRLEEGMSYKDIAAITGRTEGNVGNILHHAVKNLSARLAGARQEGRARS